MNLKSTTVILKLFVVISIIGLFIGCGGSGGSDDKKSPTDQTGENNGSDSTGECEQVSSGNSYVKVINSSNSMIEVYLSDSAFGADIGPGECNLIGIQLPGSYSSYATKAEISQCTESPDGGCNDDGLFGNTKTVSFTLQKDKVYTITVVNSFFN